MSEKSEKSRKRSESEEIPLSHTPRAGRDPAVYAPYPELVDPGPKWRVLDSLSRPWLPSIGVTDKGNRVVYTPLRADGHDVSTHELAHVAWSPPAFPRVRFEPMVLHAVEDARINLGLLAAGLGLASDAERRARVRLRGIHDLKHGGLEIFVLRTVASLGTPSAPDLLGELEAAPPRAEAWVRSQVRRIETGLESARLRTGDPVAPFRVGLVLARELARELERRGFLRAPLELPELACCVAISEEQDGAGDGGSPLARLRARMRGKEKEDPRPGAQAGRLTIREAPMPLGRPPGARALGRRQRPAAEGCIISRPHRMPLDGAVFRRPRRWRGGTVLIDTSGSMHLSPEAVAALVEASGGAALVAIYSGRERAGELRVVARGGRRAEAGDLEPFGTGNVVDVPALEWLARQAEPRLWISDGGVTGEMDRSSREIRRRCAVAVRRGRIERVASAEEAARRLAAKGSRG